MPEQRPEQQPGAASVNDEIWTISKQDDGAGGVIVRWEKMDAGRSPCTVCLAVGVVAYVNCAGIVVDSGISASPKTPDRALRHDYTFCRECAAVVERRDLDGLVARRLSVDPRRLGLSGKTAVQQRDPVVRSEFATLFESLDGRELITSATSDFRLGITTGFESGTIGALSAPDEREPDCHQWMEQQGPIDPTHFEDFKESFRHRYSYAIPNRAALDAVAQYSPGGVLDFGAGNGYWKFVLEGNGVSVRAIDQYQLPQNPFWGPRWRDYHRSWAPVTTGTTRNVAKGNSMRTLLLVWPPANDAMADEALAAFKGDTVIYVGEWRAATAELIFHNRLKVMWRLIESIAIPTLFGFFDRMRIYKRRPEEEIRAIVFDWERSKQTNVS